MCRPGSHSRQRRLIPTRMWALHRRPTLVARHSALYKVLTLSICNLLYVRCFFLLLFDLFAFVYGFLYIYTVETESYKPFGPTFMSSIRKLEVGFIISILF